MAISIPLTKYQAFKHTRCDGRGWGEHFYDYMGFAKLDKPFDRVWCDRLYTATDTAARQMVLSVIDHSL